VKLRSFTSYIITLHNIQLIIMFCVSLMFDYVIFNIHTKSMVVIFSFILSLTTLYREFTKIVDTNWTCSPANIRGRFFHFILLLPFPLCKTYYNILFHTNLDLSQSITHTGAPVLGSTQAIYSKSIIFMLKLFVWCIRVSFHWGPYTTKNLGKDR